MENLPEMTDEMLGGLHATQELKNEIIKDINRILKTTNEEKIRTFYKVLLDIVS